METIILTVAQLSAAKQALRVERLVLLGALPQQAADAVLRYESEQHARHATAQEVETRRRNAATVARYREQKAARDDTPDGYK